MTLKVSILNNQSTLEMAPKQSFERWIESFKNQGNLSCYANLYTQKEYYLNSVAKSHLYKPVGDMDYLLNLYDFQEKLAKM
jgi:protease-4